MRKRVALVIRAAGDPQLCAAAAEAFESPEMRRLKLENTVLKKDRDAIRMMELEALRREVDAYLYSRRRFRRLRERFWRQISRIGLKLMGGAKA